MPEPPKPKPKGGMQILGLPWWAWLAAVGGGLLVGFVFLRKKDNVPTMIGQSSPLDAASAGARNENGAPADQLSSDVLAALGYLAEGQATLGDTLAQILAGGGSTVIYDALVGGIATLAAETLAPTANRLAFLRHARVDNLVFEFIAERTFHRRLSCSV